MSSSLSVDLNRSRLHDIAVVDEFSADAPFTVELSNEGEAAHVHLHLDDELSRVARLGAGNHYVEAGATRSVLVDVDSVDAPVTGKLKIVTGYGSEQEYVDVTVDPPPDRKDPVDVDERFADPPPRDLDSEPTGGEQLAGLVDDGALPLVGFGTLAILGAVTVGLLVDSPAVLLGVGVVIGVAIAGLAFAVR